MNENLGQRLLDSLFTPELTEQILHLSLPEGADERLADLRQKANDGRITAEEQAEYEQFVDTLDMLGELRATAQEAAQRRVS